MKTRLEVTPEKLRGGFYTPRGLVEACLRRIEERLPHGRLSFLEPSAGDGAFIRALAENWAERVESVFAVEPLEIEAEKTRRMIAQSPLDGTVAPTSAISWAATSTSSYDVAVGNPPFVRYQFLTDSDRSAIPRLGERLGVEFAGVSNLWVPVLLSALSRVRPGGAFAFVIPTECLTGCSAGVARRWLIDECAEVTFDLFPPGSFPEVLQEVLILSGSRKRAESTAAPLRMRVVERHAAGSREWSYAVNESSSWTRYLLDPPHLEALEEARQAPLAAPLSDLVAFEVSIVTGANDFFTVDEATVAAYDLAPWARPLLPRIRHAPGVTFTQRDQAAAQNAGAKTWLLDFAPDRPDPMKSRRPRAYLALGAERELQRRYKCRIREPWYRVPGIRRGQLLLSKRSHHFPRVIVNEAEVFTTDTIYRGRMLTADRSAHDVAAVFHNSLTLLTAELEGRSFGGGVLELVPSEIARLTTLIPANAQAALPRLDRVSRTQPDALIEATDDYLIKVGALSAEVIPLLREARLALLMRRLDRNRRIDEEPLDAASSLAA